MAGGEVTGKSNLDSRPMFYQILIDIEMEEKNEP